MNPDKTFKPGDNIQFVEAAKILTKTFGLDAREETDLWYEVYVEALQKNNYIPTTVKTLDQKVNRGELSEMMWRILQKVTNKASTEFDVESGKTTNTPQEEAKGELALCTDKKLPDSVDMKKVREAWLTWHNDARKGLDVAVLEKHQGLDYSATVWAEENKKEGAASHTRKDNQTVNDWFKALGITFKPLSGFVYAESIGSQNYTCTEADCSDEVIAASKSMFDAFMKEKGTTSTRHYDNIIESDFKQLGLGVAIDSVNNKLYLTTHYAQAVEAYPGTCAL